jgi:hypothetical protein
VQHKDVFDRVQKMGEIVPQASEVCRIEMGSETEQWIHKDMARLKVILTGDQGRYRNASCTKYANKIDTVWR